MALSEAAAREAVLNRLKILYPSAFTADGSEVSGVQISKLAEAIASLIPYIVDNNEVSVEVDTNVTTTVTTPQGPGDGTGTGKGTGTGSLS